MIKLLLIVALLKTALTLYRVNTGLLATKIAMMALTAKTVLFTA